MHLRNASQHPVILRKAETDEGQPLPQGHSEPVDETVRLLRILEPSGGDAAGMEIACEPGASFLDGVGDDDDQATLRSDGVGDDDDQATLRSDGSDPSGGSPRRPSLYLQNAGGRPVRVFVERTLPASMAFRLLGELDVVEITDELTGDGELALVLRSS